MARLPASNRTSPSIERASSARNASASTTGWGFSARKSSTGSSGNRCVAIIKILSDAEFFGVSVLEFESATRARQIETKRPLLQLRHAIEQHAFDADVIVEIFDVFQRQSCASHVCVLRGSTMG